MRPLLILPLFYTIFAGLLLAITVLIAPSTDGYAPDLSDRSDAVVNENIVTDRIDGRTASPPPRRTPHPDLERVDELQLF